MKDTISKTDKPIGLAADHAGFELKQQVMDMFDQSGIKYINYGTDGPESVDYPDFAHKLGQAIQNGECEYGITFCGSGNGINMVMNKYSKIRSALCWDVDIVKLAREHNNANALSLPARFLTKEEGLKMVEVFFNTPFDGGRHQIRIDKIPISE